MTNALHTLLRGSWASPVPPLPFVFQEQAAFVGATSAVVSSWNRSGHPVVRVERGWGTGSFYDLYAWSDGALYTGQAGSGERADAAWAGGSVLLVERIYDQSGSDPSTDYISALDATRRVVLDVSVPTAPAFGGRDAGTQDPSQHATERGYALPAGATLQTNAHPLTVLALHEHVGTEDVRIVQDDSTGAQRFNIQTGNRRSFPQWAVVVRTATNNPVTNVPLLHVSWARDNARGIATDYTQHAGINGVFTASSAPTSNATSYGLNLFGPVDSLRGRSYLVALFDVEPSPSEIYFGGIPKRAARLVADRVQDDKPSIAYPYPNAVVPMDLSTETADIPVRLLGKRSTEYEASWQGGSYASIGTTDENGYLDGAMSSQSKGNGTLNVREVGGSTPVACANVAVGVVLYAMGESGADGRGDNVTHTIPTGSLRLNRVNWTAASNEWWKLFCQSLYDEFACVIGVTKLAAGSTFFYRADNGQEGQWSVDNTVNNPPLAAQAPGFALGMQGELLTPNFWLWDIGKNDASLATTGAQYKTRFENLLGQMRTDLANDAVTFRPIITGQNGTVPASRTDGIRLAQIELIDGEAGFEPMGSFAHLPSGTDGTHFETQAEKQAAADVCFRTVLGSGRGPQFSSVTASGTSVVVTLAGGVSPMTISAGTDTGGWSVTDGAGARTVSNVAVSGLQVTLTVDQALTGTVDVSWSSDDSAVGTTLLDSDAATPLPPEPFNASVDAS